MVDGKGGERGAAWMNDRKKQKSQIRVPQEEKKCREEEQTWNNKSWGKEGERQKNNPLISTEGKESNVTKK